MLELDIQIPGTQPRSYKIHIGQGLLGTVVDAVAAGWPRRAQFVVTDANVAGAGLLNALCAGREIPAFVIDPPGEQSKHVQTVVAIVEAMEKASLGRDTVVLALGGGTVGDIGAFAASIFKRGVAVVQIPTTSLAQADSAVGGKTGVDSSVSKNAFGTFWHPAAVYIDVDTLKTLDERQFRAGLVESVKHGMIADKDYFEFIETHLDALLARDPGVLGTLAEKNCRIKGHVVAIDPDEKDMRRILNYGHTLGHAVESASRYRLLHGEAVAIGMMGASLIEGELGLGQAVRPDRVRALFDRLGVPTRIPPYILPDQVMGLLSHDKKAIDKWPKFVLTIGFGQVYRQDGRWAADVHRDVVAKAISSLY
jgi:3-dehydroquinate synthase